MKQLRKHNRNIRKFNHPHAWSCSPGEAAWRNDGDAVLRQRQQKWDTDSSFWDRCHKHLNSCQNPLRLSSDLTLNPV